jgi:aspartyl-tRNA(Asn)/glutamyl-tRNA(Gln) amidotransferase subunit C
MGERMRIGADEVRHVAQLAELAIADGDVPLLAAQLEGIVNFVAQLDEVAVAGASGASGAVVVGPSQLRLREDRVDPIRMERPPAQFAPAFQQGFFVVPKLGGLAEA